MFFIAKQTNQIMKCVQRMTKLGLLQEYKSDVALDNQHDSS